MRRITLGIWMTVALAMIVACGGGESSADATQTAEAQRDEALTATYELQLLEQVGGLNDSITRFVELSNADPSAPDWISSVEAELELWKSTVAAARELTPSQSYAQAHETYLIAMDHFESAADDFLAGMEAGDQSLMSAGLQSLETAIEHINLTRDQFPD